VQAAWPLYPRGPRSGPGYSVPVHHRLSDPIRPTRRHIPISPHSGLYEMPSLCARLRAPRRPPSGSELSCSALYRHVVAWDPGKLVGCIHPVPSPTTLAFDRKQRSRRFPHPHTPILMGDSISGLYCRSLSLQPADLLASLSELTGVFLLANRGFYVRAFNGLIALSVAGYNYGGNWASSTGWTPTS